MGRKAESSADLLPSAQLCDSGLVFIKQGDLVAGYCFRLPDNDSRTAEEADVLFSSGWSSWADVVSFPAGRYPPASARTGLPFKGRR
nr:hypothetical protein [uncultured Rhodopila sp.]